MKALEETFTVLIVCNNNNNTIDVVNSNDNNDEVDNELKMNESGHSRLINYRFEPDGTVLFCFRTLRSGNWKVQHHSRH